MTSIPSSTRTFSGRSVYASHSWLPHPPPPMSKVQFSRFNSGPSNSSCQTRFHPVRSHSGVGEGTGVDVGLGVEVGSGVAITAQAFNRNIMQRAIWSFLDIGILCVY